MHYVFFYFKKRLFWRGVWDGHRTHMFALTKPTKLETSGMASLAGTKPLQSLRVTTTSPEVGRSGWRCWHCGESTSPATSTLNPIAPTSAPPTSPQPPPPPPPPGFPSPFSSFFLGSNPRLLYWCLCFFPPVFSQTGGGGFGSCHGWRLLGRRTAFGLVFFFFNCFSDFGFLIMFRSGAIGVEWIFELLLTFSWFVWIVNYGFCILMGESFVWLVRASIGFDCDIIVQLEMGWKIPWCGLALSWALRVFVNDFDAFNYRKFSSIFRFWMVVI